MHKSSNTFIVKDLGGDNPLSQVQSLAPLARLSGWRFMMPSTVILYDLPSQQGTSWSLNPWKTRMILNYKNIDYKTEWVEYPHLAPTFQSFGIPPNEPKANPVGYSSPAIQYADGTYEMDSWPIAHSLEKHYPEPSLHLDEPIVIRMNELIADLSGPLRPHVIPKVPFVLNKVSADYYYKTRKQRFGKSLQEVLDQNATEDCWEKVKIPVKEAGDALKKYGGPFFLGETVSYADMIFVAFLHFLRRVDDGVFVRFLSLDPMFPKLYEVSKPWLVKDD